MNHVKMDVKRLVAYFYLLTLVTSFLTVFSTFTPSVVATTPVSDYYYVGGDATQRVWQVWTINSTKKSQSADLGDDINGITEDELYVYATTDSREIYKIYKSNMTTKQFEGYPAHCMEIVSDSLYLYVGVGWEVYKVLKSNLSTVAATLGVGSLIRGIAVDDSYVYAVSASSQTVRQYWKSNMTMKKESTSFDGDPLAVCVDDSYVYVSKKGSTTDRIYKFRKDVLTCPAVYRTADFGGYIDVMLEYNGDRKSVV